jgi:hypothetical protein
MDDLEDPRATALELLDFARQKDTRLDALLDRSGFQTDDRSIFFWREQANLPEDAPSDSAIGLICYNMQGAISVLPLRFQESSDAFQGVWHEVGSLDDMEHAFAFLKAWLLDRKEIDELPPRKIKRCGI